MLVHSELLAIKMLQEWVAYKQKFISHGARAQSKIKALAQAQCLVGDLLPFLMNFLAYWTQCSAGKNPPALRASWFDSWSREDLLEEVVLPHFQFLACFPGQLSW